MSPSLPPLSYFKKSLLLLWISHLIVDFFTGIWPIYKTIAGLDIATAGLIAGLTGFLGESCQIFFGNLADRGHRKKILILGMVLASSILWITFCTSTLECFFILLLLMIGSGCYHPAAAGMASSLSKLYKGRTILLFASGGAIGLGISQLAFTGIISGFGGHAVIAFIPVGLAFCFLFFHRFPDIRSKPAPFSLKGFFQPLIPMKKPLALLYFSQVANQAVVMSFTFLLPDFLREKGCHSWLCFGGGHCCFILGSALTMIPAGFSCDRLGHRSVLAATLISATCFLYLFLSQSALSFFSAGVLLFLLGGFLGIVNPLIVSWGNRLVPEHPSTVSALLMGFAWCLGNLGPSLAGALAKLFPSGGYFFALSAMGLLLVAALALVFSIPKELQPLSESVDEA